MADYIDKYVSPSFSMREKITPMHAGPLGITTSFMAYLASTFVIKLKKEDGFSNNINNEAFEGFIKQFETFDYKLIKPFRSEFYDEDVKLFGFERGGFDLEHVLETGVSKGINHFLSKTQMYNFLLLVQRGDCIAVNSLIEDKSWLMRGMLSRLELIYHEELKDSRKPCAQGWYSSERKKSRGYNFGIRGKSDVVSAVKKYLVQ